MAKPTMSTNAVTMRTSSLPISCPIIEGYRTAHQHMHRRYATKRPDRWREDMTEWTPTLDAPDTVDEASLISGPPRTLGRSALRPATSRRDLYAEAGAQTRLVRGRNAFVWRGRVLPIGLPLASAAG